MSNRVVGKMIRFQSPLGEVVKETLLRWIDQCCDKAFQSPLGEVVKETGLLGCPVPETGAFQSPLGEVVKETFR